MTTDELLVVVVVVFIGPGRPGLPCGSSCIPSAECALEKAPSSLRLQIHRHPQIKILLLSISSDRSINHLRHDPDPNPPIESYPSPIRPNLNPPPCSPPIPIET
ncbi:hypothetical protein NL676_022062 [Syzygium grande]|nr:hypothetical protein NL676_022062 [Syzygium grande]